MNNLLVAGTKIAAVAANNEEMAIGAILALQQAGKGPKNLVIGGIDATQDALREMDNLAVTVFQDPKAQGRGSGGDRRQVHQGRTGRFLCVDPVSISHQG